MFFRAKRNLGLLLTGVWLILTGLLPLLNLTHTALTLVMQILAIAAGALLIMGR